MSTWSVKPPRKSSACLTTDMRLLFLQTTAILLAFTAPLWAAAHLANTLNASPITTHQP